MILKVLFVLRKGETVPEATTVDSADHYAAHPSCFDDEADAALYNLRDEITSHAIIGIEVDEAAILRRLGNETLAGKVVEA